MRLSKLTLCATIIFFSFLSPKVKADNKTLDLKFAGALEFSNTGTLFVGDNFNGAIYAFDIDADSVQDNVKPIRIGDIDVRIANILGVGPRAVEINDMKVHPKSREIFISVSRINGHRSEPAVVKVAQDGGLEVLDLVSYSFTKQNLAHYPDQKTTFKPRGLMGMPPTTKDITKANNKLSSLAIMDLLFHEGELLVSGVAYDDFLSTLRRISYPFDGTQRATNVEMYHIAHDQYETRAPIRAMSIQEIDGKNQLIAAYTCSPLVLIPLDKIVDGAKISANTIADIGNGQPIDMIPYKLNDQNLLFLTSNSRSPQVIPLAGLNDAQVVTDKDFERGPKLDISPIMPFGPVGKSVMFDGSSLHMDLLSDNFFVSITRDVKTGSLNLDSNQTIFPNRLHNLVAEFDFPQYKPGANKKLP